MKKLFSKEFFTEKLFNKEFYTKKVLIILAVSVLALATCISLVVFFSCDANKTGGEEQTSKVEQTTDKPSTDETTGMPGNSDDTFEEYNVEIKKGTEFGEIEVTPVKAEENGILYTISVKPNAGYVVKTIKVGDAEVVVEDNKSSCVLSSDTTVEVTYSRKTNDELEGRREKVLKKMQQITGTQFRYDRDYNYSISSTDLQLKADTVYQGMPYSNVPTLSFDAFLDFTTGKDANGVYTVGDIMGNSDRRFIWGNNCADVVYWSWATVSSSINCAISYEFTEKFNCVYVGDFKITDDDYEENGCYKNTLNVCLKNGEQKMFEAYAMLMKGDGAVFYRNGGHVIMIGSVNVVRDDKGLIDGSQSYITFYEQNVGYSRITGVDGNSVLSSCAYDEKMTFDTMYSKYGYLPVTCRELMDDCYAVEKETVTDSVNASALNKDNVTQGKITSNYYISKLNMIITDAAGKVVYNVNRYRDEGTPKSMEMSWFTSDALAQYTHAPIYDDMLNLDTFEAGKYHCKVTVFLSTGYSHVVRDFDFSIESNTDNNAGVVNPDETTGTATDETTGKTPDETTGVTQPVTPTLQMYNVNVTKGDGLGTVNATAVRAEGNGTLYEIAVSPKLGYVVAGIKVSGSTLNVSNNKATCILTGDASVEITYSRKTNSELEARRTTVLQKMQQITGTQFRYDRDYIDYSIGSKNLTIQSGTLYQGMPYSVSPTLSFEAFLDFTTGKDENGVYIVGDIMGNAERKYIWGNNCADAVYWSWCMVSSTIECTVSQQFTAKMGCVYVGDFTVKGTDYDSSWCYKNTKNICKRNGLQKMIEAYALLKKGDGLVKYGDGNHVMMAESVYVVRDSSGNIDPLNSYVKIYEQSGGYRETTGVNGGTVTTSCSRGKNVKFYALYDAGYLPITCRELLDESYAVEKEVVSDSINASALNKDTITQGKITSNYYFSKLNMTITDLAGNEVYNANRYRYEGTIKSMEMSWFTCNSLTHTTTYPVYNDAFDINSLPSGTYNCKVTAQLGTGNSYVVRDFQFNK